MLIVGRFTANELEEGFLKDCWMDWAILQMSQLKFQCCKKNLCKEISPKHFFKKQIYPKIWKNSSTNKLVETNLTKHIWKNYQKITEGESLPNNPWRKIRTKNLWREIFAKKSLPNNFWSNKSTKKNLKKHLHQQSCWRKTSNKKLLQRNFYPKILKSTFLPKKNAEKPLPDFEEKPLPSNRCRKIFDTISSSQKSKKNTNEIWRKIHT